MLAWVATRRPGEISGLGSLTTGRIAGMEVASLILGIIGTATGVGALIWQVVTWKRSGPVVTVDVNQGVPTYGPDVNNLVTFVTATNSGRAPVTVTSWGLELPDGQTIFIQEPFPGSDAIPCRLEEGASGKWLVETIRVTETSRAQGVDYADLRGFVKLGNGKTVYAGRQGIQLGPGFPRPQETRQ